MRLISNGITFLLSTLDFWVYEVVQYSKGAEDGLKETRFEYSPQSSKEHGAFSGLWVRIEIVQRFVICKNIVFVGSNQEIRYDSTLEEDFFLRSASSLIPVEIKAKSGRSKSLRTLIDSEQYPDIRYGFKLSMNNIGHEDRIYTFPYFSAFLLKRFMSTFQPEEEQL